MKIITHGIQKYPNAVDYELECTNCGCMFLFGAEDFICQEKRIDGFATVRCPECNKELMFKPSKHLYDGIDEFLREIKIKYE